MNRDWRDWLEIISLAGCIGWAFVARHHARKAADKLAEAKKLVATMWNNHEAGS